MRKFLGGAVICLATFSAHSMAQAVEVESVLATYANIAEAAYADSVQTARKLQDEINGFVENPTDETLAKAREAWIAARVPYQQTEVFRFSSPLMAEGDKRVNAWPINEGLIDYVDEKAYGAKVGDALKSANVIATTSVTLGGGKIDAKEITPELLERLQGAGDAETNVATGYHAIEFLLWGQDLNGTGPGAGDRKATDYSIENCTNRNCDRRADYLKAAATTLVTDLETMAEAWAQDGEARKSVMTGDPQAALKAILNGMARLSKEELAEERLRKRLGQEDANGEYEAFSDNSPASFLNSVRGIANVYLGTYKAADGKEVKGPSISEVIAEKDAAVDADVKAKLAVSLASLQVIVDRAKKGEAFDQLVAKDNAIGNAIVNAAIIALDNQTKAIEAAVKALDNPVKAESKDAAGAPEKTSN